LNDKTIFEKQLENSIIEKETIRNEQLGHPTFEKEVDFENLWGNREQKNEVENFRINSPRSLRISLIKY
jgi:DNA recombination protein RmuC